MKFDEEKVKINSFTNWGLENGYWIRGTGSVFNFKSASFGDLAFASSGLGEDILAVIAGDNGLGMAEDNICLAASSAFDVHEIGVRSGD